MSTSSHAAPFTVLDRTVSCGHAACIHQAQKMHRTSKINVIAPLTPRPYRCTRCDAGTKTTPSQLRKRGSNGCETRPAIQRQIRRASGARIARGIERRPAGSLRAGAAFQWRLPASVRSSSEDKRYRSQQHLFSPRRAALPAHRHQALRLRAHRQAVLPAGPRPAPRIASTARNALLLRMD